MTEMKKANRRAFTNCRDDGRTLRVQKNITQLSL